MAKGAIIVGAGPVGLMLAGELALGGVDVEIYDRLPGPSGESRGVGFTRRAAEVFHQRGLLHRLGEVEWAQGHFGGVRIDFGALEDNHFSVRGVAQFRTESMLEGWLAELGVTVRRGYEVVDYRETDEGVTVVFDGPEGRGEESARYLIGCDGGRSLVRQLAGIEFPGWSATRGMYMADIIGSNVRQRPIGEKVPGGMVMAFNLEDGVDRIVIHEKGLRPQDKGAVTWSEVADAWERMTGEDLHGAEVRWVSSFTDATRQAASYRKGRVFLAGDATHIHMPAGAQGLSVGVQDAVNLGWKLAATINGWAPEGLLDTYESERHPVGERLMRNTRAQTQLYLTGEEMEPLRAVMREIVLLPEAARHLAGIVSGLDIRYEVGAGEHRLLGGRLLPDLEFERQDGGRSTVAELMHSGRGILFDVGDTGDAEKVAGGWVDRIDIVRGDWVPAGPVAARADGSLLIRPDGHVVWANPEGGDLTAALNRWFGAEAVAS
ncbi:FAD-dependent monooxygenase [Streptomyces sp. NPDC006879]|uniref:FAD-dependent monooxygenase n=1 Tax=Streptomyces sp. NPDC006879 TaxID=3364767 RepID=UPI003695DCB1